MFYTVPARAPSLPFHHTLFAHLTILSIFLLFAHPQQAPKDELGDGERISILLPPSSEQRFSSLLCAHFGAFVYAAGSTVPSKFRSSLPHSLRVKTSSQEKRILHCALWKKSAHHRRGRPISRGRR